MAAVVMRMLVRAAMWLASHPDEVIAVVHEVKALAHAVTDDTDTEK